MVSTSHDMVDSTHPPYPDTSFWPARSRSNPEAQVSDWKTSAKENLEVASRFIQTLLKKVPECVSTNPVKMAFSIAKVIIDIKDVGRLLYM